MHSANVLHRDLKPSNLLVNSDCGLGDLLLMMMMIDDDDDHDHDDDDNHRL